MAGGAGDTAAGMPQHGAPRCTHPGSITSPAVAVTGAAPARAAQAMSRSPEVWGGSPHPTHSKHRVISAQQELGLDPALSGAKPPFQWLCSNLQ